MLRGGIFFIFIFFSALVALVFTGIALSATNIDSENKYAYDDMAGFWDFFETGTVEVTNTELTGYASSSLGYLALNCNSTPNGDICATSNFKVCNGDWNGTTCENAGTGKLSGCAWNDTIGWVSFSCASYDCQGFGGSHDICSQSPYGVEIDADGYFSGRNSPTGYAWNDVVGWMQFSNFQDSVQTSWRGGRLAGYLESSTVDTKNQKGANLNSIIWQGVKSVDAPVDFQIAGAHQSTGPWSYQGPDGTESTYYGGGCPYIGQGNTEPDTPICIDASQVANYRYLRYRIRLQSDPGQSTTSLVTNVILNFSR